MKRPDPIREPTYNWPTGNASDENATPVERALAALKAGAILALAVTIVLIYVATYGGWEAGRDRASLLVLTAFVSPSLIAYLLARRSRRRGADRSDPPADP